MCPSSSSPLKCLALHERRSYRRFRYRCGYRVRRARPVVAAHKFDLLGSGAQFIGIDGIDEPLFAETLSIPRISEFRTRDEEEMLQSVVAVHWLRAVTCLYGFTHLEPAATYTEEMLEDVRLTVATMRIAVDRCKRLWRWFSV
jgi:hypothetical protein